MAPSATADKKRIVVVDDNRDSAEMLSVMLELHGHEVLVAHTGREALAIARERQPQIILLDIGLPDMNGHAIAREVRADPQLASILLIALTGWGAAEDRRKTLASGFDHHLTKPVAIKDLESLFHRAIS